MPPNFLILLATLLIYIKLAVIILRRPSTLVLRRYIIMELGAL